MPTDDRPNVHLVPFPTRQPIATGDDRAMHLYLVPTATGARAGFTRTTTDTARRAYGSATPRERTAMYTIHQVASLEHAYADMRHRDLMAEAEQARRLALAVGATTRRSVVAVAVAALRRQVGIALVRAGQRVHGAEPADALSNPGTLRAAR